MTCWCFAGYEGRYGSEMERDLEESESGGGGGPRKGLLQGMLYTDVRNVVGRVPEEFIS